LEDLRMDASNPYAPPQATVHDITDPAAGLVLADRGTRLGAAILDGIILVALVYLPMTLGVALMGSDGELNPIAAVPMTIGLLGCILWAWLNIVYVSRNGQSIGKKMLAIKVVRSDGTRASLGRIFWLRNVVNGLISIIPLYGLVDVLFIFSETRQCLHDKLADTVVVKA
jgi:uncharacterized RDD family membrane protein YckC